MADTISGSQELYLQWQFLDGDDRQFRLANPKDNLTEADINNVGTFMANNDFLVGDRNGMPISQTAPLKKAFIRRQQKISLDLS